MGVSLFDRLRPGAGFVRTGHRGARGLEPENTLVGFHRAAEVGVDVLEMDVRMTLDGEICLMHDPAVDRTTDGVGLVHETTWEELSTLDAAYRWAPSGEACPRRGEGIRIPRLREVLSAFPEHVFTVELKPSPQPEFVQVVIDLVRDLAPGRVILASFEQALVRAVRGLAPEIPTNLSNREIHVWYLLSRVLLGGLVRTAGRVLQIPYWSNYDHDRGLRMVTPSLLRSAHRGGRSVQVWTINDPDHMRRLIDMGVDGITTDRPDVLNDVLSERA